MQLCLSKTFLNGFFWKCVAVEGDDAMNGVEACIHCIVVIILPGKTVDIYQSFEVVALATDCLAVKE